MKQAKEVTSGFPTRLLSGHMFPELLCKNDLLPLCLKQTNRETNRQTPTSANRNGGESKSFSPFIAPSRIASFSTAVETRICGS